MLNLIIIFLSKLLIAFFSNCSKGIFFVPKGKYIQIDINKNNITYNFRGINYKEI